MTWNWQQKDWPHFTWDKHALEPLERKYAHITGRVFASIKHLPKGDRDELVVRILAQDGVKTAEIEGEFLNRDSVQASIRRKLGLTNVCRKVNAAEEGVAALMIDVYTAFKKELTHNELHQWNKALTQERSDLEEKGAYRIHEEPMQIIFWWFWHGKSSLSRTSLKNSL